jgi:parallel beta-helix repeat protein
MSHPRRNEVFRDVGSQWRDAYEEGFIDIEHLPFRSGAALLLCSDGLSDTLSKAQMFSVISASRDRTSIVGNLIQAALGQAKDNITAVFVQVDAASKTARSIETIPNPAATRPADATEPSTVLVRQADKRKPLLWAAAVAGAVILGSLVTLAAEYVLGVGPFPAKTIAHGGGVAAPANVLRVSMNSGQNPIAAALAKAKSGDLIEVSEGQYSDNLQLKDGVTLIGANATLHATGIAVSADHVQNARISGFRIVNDPSTNGLVTGVSVRGGQVQVEQVEVAGAQKSGIEFSGDAKGDIQGCLIHHNGGPGIQVSESAAPDVQGNIIFSNGYTPGATQPGLRLAVAAPGQITKNTFLGNAAGAIGSVHPSNAWLTQNEFGANGAKGKAADVRQIK